MLFRGPTKKKFAIIVVLVAFFAILIPIASVHAGDDGLLNTVADLGTSILVYLIKLGGGILTALISILITASEYNDFINARAVVNGWVIVRDVANMFFVVILLIMAFGTILGEEQYHYKKILPKLLIMAVVVNFSRTIMGVMIDFAQVVMLTFVNGYKAAAGGNFANIFQIIKLLQYKEESCGSIDPGAIFVASLLAFIMIMVSLMTVFVIVAVLILRIIMLWLLTILSPVAFLLGTFPQGQKYYAQWWEEFKNQVMVGPVLAFFLWLSLVTVGSGDAARQIGPKVSVEGQVTIACSAVGSADDMMSFIIGTMMLLAGVQMAESMGSAVSGIMGRAKGALRSATKTLTKAGVGAIGLGIKAAGKGGSYAGERIQASTGIELRPSVYKEAYKHAREKTKARRRAEGYGKGIERMRAAEKGGRARALFTMATASPQDFFQHGGAILSKAGPKQAMALARDSMAYKAKENIRSAFVSTPGEMEKKTQEIIGVEEAAKVSELEDKIKALTDKASKAGVGPDEGAIADLKGQQGSLNGAKGKLEEITKEGDRRLLSAFREMSGILRGAFASKRDGKAGDKAAKEYEGQVRAAAGVSENDVNLHLQSSAGKARIHEYLSQTNPETTNAYTETEAASAVERDFVAQRAGAKKSEGDWSKYKGSDRSRYDRMLKDKRRALRTTMPQASDDELGSAAERSLRMTWEASNVGDAEAGWRLKAEEQGYGKEEEDRQWDSYKRDDRGAYNRLLETKKAEIRRNNPKATREEISTDAESNLRAEWRSETEREMEVGVQQKFNQELGDTIVNVATTMVQKQSDAVKQGLEDKKESAESYKDSATGRSLGDLMKMRDRHDGKRQEAVRKSKLSPDELMEEGKKRMEGQMQMMLRKLQGAAKHRGIDNPQAVKELIRKEGTEGVLKILEGAHGGVPISGIPREELERLVRDRAQLVDEYYKKDEE